MNTTFIYALLEPETNEVRYVGKADNPQKRYAQHLQDRREYHKVRWIRRLKARGLQPLLEIIEEVPMESWPERECYWIAHYRSQGCRLTNGHPGGVGGSEVCSPETRAKIAAAHTGRKWPAEIVTKRAAAQRNPSAETRAKFAANSRARVWTEVSRTKISASKRGKTRGPLSEGHRQKIGNAFRGKKQSPEFIARRAASLRGRTLSEETKAKISATRRRLGIGKDVKRPPFSDEWRRNISAAKKGQRPSEETKAKQAEARRGKKRSTETRTKISEALRGRKRPDVKPNLGKTTPPEIRAKIAESLRGRKLSPESIEKRSAAIKGRKHSAEAIEKMREAARQRWAMRKAQQASE